MRENALKHPALAKVMSVALAVMSIVMIGFGAFKIADSIEERNRSLEATSNLAAKIENYKSVCEELDASTVDYTKLSAEQTERQDKYTEDNSQHLADLAEYTATKGGLEQGSLALDDAAYNLNIGEQELWAGREKFMNELGEYAYLVDSLPSAEQLAEVKKLLDEAQAESDRWNGRFDEVQKKLDELRASGVSEVTLAQLETILSDLLAQKDQLTIQEQEALSAYDAAAADMSLADSIKAEIAANTALTPEEQYAQLNQRVLDMTGKTLDQIAGEMGVSAQNLQDIRGALDDLNKRIEDAGGQAENVKVTIDEVQKALDDARVQKDLANSKLAEVKDLYDKLMMAIEAKAMMDAAEAQIAQGRIAIGDAWYEIQQKKSELDDTHKRLQEEKEQLTEDYKMLDKVERTVDEYDELTSRHKAARTALTVYPDIKSRVEAGGDVAESAEAALEKMKEDSNHDFGGRLGISILSVLSGICGLMTLPSAFERMKIYPAIVIFTALSLLFAAAAEALGMALGWGQTYAALFGAIFALGLLLFEAPVKAPVEYSGEASA